MVLIYSFHHLCSAKMFAIFNSYKNLLHIGQTPISCSWFVTLEYTLRGLNWVLGLFLCLLMFDDQITFNVLYYLDFIKKNIIN